MVDLKDATDKEIEAEMTRRGYTIKEVSNERLIRELMDRGFMVGSK